MFEEPKMIILGSDGFVGKNLSNKLKSQGYCVDNINRSKIDLTNQKDVYDYFINCKKNDIVFLAAALVGGIKANMENPYMFLMQNLKIQCNVLDACVKSKIKKMVFLGSSCIYPKNREILKEEDLLTGELEETNLGYSLAKISGLKICEFANKQFGKNFISLQPSNLYGPGDCFDSNKSHVLSATIKKVIEAKEKNEPIKIWGDGKPRREFLYIDDCVDAIIWSIKNIKNTETFLNVGSGEDISIIDLTKKVCDIVDYHPEFIFDETKPNGMMKRLMDSSKINRLGWKSKTSLDDGIKKTVEYYLNMEMI
jgi:GDP-L-fucose synthase